MNYLMNQGGNMNKILNDKFINKILKTFFEGFLASLIVNIQTNENITDLNILKNILIGGIAMGISSVLNLIQIYLNKEKS